MRLFIALDLPVSAVDMLCALQRRLAEAGIGGRAVPRQNLHIPLRFLAEQEPDKLPLIRQAAQNAMADFAAPMISLTGIGAFIRPGGDTVYAQLGGQLETLSAMEKRLSQQLQAIGIAPDMRPFMPHITLMRRARFPSGGGRAAKSEPFFLSGLGLYASDLSGASPQYERLYHIPLLR